MEASGSFLEILFLAILAGVILYRLRDVLGRRTGQERQSPLDPYAPQRQSDENADSNVIPLPTAYNNTQQTEQEQEPRAPMGRRAMTSIADEAYPVLERMREIDRHFDIHAFLDGAQVAFEMIVTAFAQGDRDTLRPLLNDTVYDNFASAIDERERCGEDLQTTILELRTVALTEAALEGSVAHLTVRFLSDQINVVRDRDGNVIEGTEGEMEEVTDIWTFSRNLNARGPDWLLVSTDSDEA